MGTTSIPISTGHAIAASLGITCKRVQWACNGLVLLYRHECNGVHVISPCVVGRQVHLTIHAPSRVWTAQVTQSYMRHHDHVFMQLLLTCAPQKGACARIQTADGWWIALDVLLLCVLAMLQLPDDAVPKDACTS